MYFKRRMLYVMSASFHNERRKGTDMFIKDHVSRNLQTTQTLFSLYMYYR